MYTFSIWTHLSQYFRDILKEGYGIFSHYSLACLPISIWRGVRIHCPTVGDALEHFQIQFLAVCMRLHPFKTAGWICARSTSSVSVSIHFKPNVFSFILKKNV
jgi:hypothetical protein